MLPFGRTHALLPIRCLLPQSFTAQEMCINTPKILWLNISHYTRTHGDTHTLKHRFVSQQAPITHRNRWRSEGLREGSGKEKSLQLAGKQLHPNSTATVYQTITLSWETLALKLLFTLKHNQECMCTQRQKHTVNHLHVNRYILWDSAGACCTAGATLSLSPHSISIPVMLWAQALYFPFSKCLSLCTS